MGERKGERPRFERDRKTDRGGRKRDRRERERERQELEREKKIKRQVQ